MHWEKSYYCNHIYVCVVYTHARTHSRTHTNAYFFRNETKTKGRIDNGRSV